MSPIAAGSVNTTWKYGTGSSSACPRLHPVARRRALALRAVPVAAAVVGDRREAAAGVLAARDVPAEGRRAAALDGAHHLQLRQGSHGRGWRHAKRRRGRGRYPRPPEQDEPSSAAMPAARYPAVEHHHSAHRAVSSRSMRAHHAPDHVGRHLRVARGRVQLRVAEQDLDDAHVDVVLEQVRREGVPERVRRDPLRQTGALGGACGRCG